MKSLAELSRHPFSDHSRILGYTEDQWQDTATILSHFAKSVSIARNKYLAFVEAGNSQGRKPELTGGRAGKEC